MKILQECKRFLSYGGLGTEKHVNIGGKCVPRTLIRASIASVVLLLVTVQIKITINSYDVGLQAMLFPLHCVLLASMKCAVYLVCLRKTKKIDELIDYIEAMVQRRCNVGGSASYTIYTKRNSNEKRIVRGIVAILSGLVVFSYVPSVICWLSTLIFGVPSTEYWMIPLGTNKAVPIDTRQPASFGVALFIDLFFLQNYMSISMIFLIIYVSIATYVRPFVDDLSATIVQPSRTIEQRIFAKEKIVQSIEMHKDLYEMLWRFERIVSVPMFLQLPMYGLILAIMLYQLEHDIADSSTSLMHSIDAIIYYAMENYMMCFFVSNIIHDTGSIGDIVYNSPWYQMPRAERICVEMIIRRSQRPFELKGMGVFVCSLETYLKLTRSSISYYMVFRKLNTV